MADLSAQALAVGGTSPTYAAASVAGDTAPVGQKLTLHVKNDSASAVTVTLATPGTVHGLSISDAAPSVAAGGDCFIPLHTVYRSVANGRASVTYSATASVSVAVLLLP